MRWLAAAIPNPDRQAVVFEFLVAVLVSLIYGPHRGCVKADPTISIKEKRQQFARCLWSKFIRKSAGSFRPAKRQGVRAHFITLREIQSSLELAERLDRGDFSTAFVRTGNIHHSGVSARPTAPLKPAHSKRFAQFVSPRQTPHVLEHLRRPSAAFGSVPMSFFEPARFHFRPHVMEKILLGVTGVRPEMRRGKMAQPFFADPAARENKVRAARVPPTRPRETRRQNHRRTAGRNRQFCRRRRARSSIPRALPPGADAAAVPNRICLRQSAARRRADAARENPFCTRAVRLR